MYWLLQHLSNVATCPALIHSRQSRPQNIYIFAFDFSPLIWFQMNVLLTLGTSVGLYKDWHTTRQTNSQTICSTGTRSQHIKHWQRKHYEHYAPLPLHLTENQEWLGSAGNKTKAGWHDHLSFVESGEARPMGIVNVHASTFGSSRITFSSRSISGNFVVSKLCWNIFHNNNASQQLLWLLMHRNMFYMF